MTPFWLISWALALAAGWLQPNHYLPWSTFYTDAWVAAVLALGAAALILRTHGPVIWHGITLLIAVLVLVPGLQYALGLVLLSGTAWIGSAYLLGLLLAMLTGAQWETSSPGQLADGLFLAIGVAALLSVGLQLHQWLGLSLLDPWSMGDGYGRPFANFGQPNQLATFLLWGLLAAGWGVARRRIGVATAVLAALYLLFGLALTQSRTAWIAVGLLLVASWFWRGLWTDRRWPWLAGGLGLYFTVCVVSLGYLNQALLLNGPMDAGDGMRLSSELRPAVWSMFIDAAVRYPVLGYGWNQVGLAQLTTILDHSSVTSLFTQSHNLILDLVLWCGIPLGLGIALYLARWLWLRLRAVNCPEDAVQMLFLLVIGNHAMLELPLQYAYFLLPVGLMIGILNVRLHAPPILLAGRWSLLVPWLVSMALLALIIWDYARVETSYQELRLESARIRMPAPGRPPDVLLLTQFREFIRMSRLEPTDGMSADDLDRMRKVAGTYPGSATMTRLALALAMNGRPNEAQLWLEKMCRIEPPSQCAAARRWWIKRSPPPSFSGTIRWPEAAFIKTSP